MHYPNFSTDNPYTYLIHIYLLCFSQVYMKVVALVNIIVKIEQKAARSKNHEPRLLLIHCKFCKIRYQIRYQIKYRIRYLLLLIMQFECKLRQMNSVSQELVSAANVVIFATKLCNISVYIINFCLSTTTHILIH